jgi:hypothetical protein
VRTLFFTTLKKRLPRNSPQTTLDFEDYLEFRLGRLLTTVVLSFYVASEPVKPLRVIVGKTKKSIAVMAEKTTYALPA